MHFEVYGAGPWLFVGWPLRTKNTPPQFDPAASVRDRYLDQLTNCYRVVLMDYPPTGDGARAAVDSFTPDRVNADVLATVDAIGANQFAWYGYSWSAVVGLQLAASTARLTALVCGGWPPIDAPYQNMLSWSERLAQRTGLAD
jgi:pimeloyl-ACP methyl ester carboxylesterase